MGIPAAFQGFPPPGLSPGGRSEPQGVYPTYSPPSIQERLEIDPLAGRDGAMIRAGEEAGISFRKATKAGVQS